MNILIVSYIPYEDGGVGSSTMALAQGLKARGFKVYIASTGDYPGIETMRLKKTIKVPFFLYRDRVLCRSLLGFIKEKKIDIVHASECKHSGVGAITAAAKARVGAVQHFRGYWFCCLTGELLFRGKMPCTGPGFVKCMSCVKKKRLPWEFYKYFYFRKKERLFKQADVKIAIGRQVKEQLAASGIKDGVRIVYDPVEMNVENINKDLKKKISQAAGNRKIGVYIGSLCGFRGIDFLLKLASDRKDRLAKLFLVVAGTGELSGWCRDIIEKKGLDNVLMLGNVAPEDIYTVYDCADMVLYPSRPAGFGRIPLEAAFAGKPVIANRTAGMDEAIIDKKTGFLLKTGNEEAWTKSILKLLNDEKKAKEMRASAKLAFAKFSTARSVYGIIEIYDKINKNSKKHSPI